MSVFLRKAKTENGWVVGIPAADPRITSFKGIPFAKPPVGELRWRAPQPAENWEGELECKEFAPISMQTPPGLDPNNIYTKEWNPDPEIAMSEDCLYLNVWTPAKTADEKHPVYVWYFGGGLKEGNAAEMEFDCERMARRGIVVVSLTYRVNSFGFLAHPELTAAQPEDATNFGHLDQRFATLWVKRNIAAFGGDPDNITIGGQSAGGMSVCAQMCSPLNEGLFQKAVIHSGIFDRVHSPSVDACSTMEASEKLGVEFFEFLGVKTLAEARALDAITLRDKTTEFNRRFSASVDGHFLTESYKTSMLKGERYPVPLMYGWTDNEFWESPKAATADELRADLAAKLGEEWANKIADAAGADTDLDAALKALALEQPELGARLFARAEEKSKGELPPRYLYRFGADIPGDDMGPFHSIDLWFWFETLAKCWRPFTGKHYDLARHMCNYLVNFVKTGDPNGVDSDGLRMPEWPVYTEENNQVMGFYEKAGAITDPVPPVQSVLIDALIDKML